MSYSGDGGGELSSSATCSPTCAAVDCFTDSFFFLLNSLIDSSSLSSFAFNDLFLDLSVFFFSPKTNSLIGGDSSGGGGGGGVGGGGVGGGGDGVISEADADGGGGGTLDNSTEGETAAVAAATGADSISVEEADAD